MGRTLIKISVLYFLLGVSLGYYMSTTEDHTLTGVHAHINLLGWTSLTLAGLIYHLFPHLTKSLLAKIHFWFHNLGLPVMMIGLWSLLSTGNEGFVPVVAVGATVTLLGILCFVINVFFNLNNE